MVPVAASAQAPDSCTISADRLVRIQSGGVLGNCVTDCVYTINDCGICCLLNTLYGISDWIFVVLIALAVLFVIMGAFQMITAAGSPEKVSSGRQYILYAAIGLAVALLARAIPAIVRTIAGA